jgi:gag-polypeptide of LTR copia-type
MGAKGLWRHVEGKALEPKNYAKDTNGVYVLADGKTPATEEQVESKEAKIEDFEKKHYLAQHIILSTTSTRLSSKIKNMKKAHEMWEAVKADVTTRSTLYLIDAENQLEGMRLSDSSDPKTHLLELKAHFQLMMQRHDNLIKMGSTFSDTRLTSIIMMSLPPSYRPALQTITAAQKASAITSTSSTSTVKLKPADLIEFFTEEAQHRVIEEDRTKSGESALYVQTTKRRP